MSACGAREFFSRCGIFRSSRPESGGCRCATHTRLVVCRFAGSRSGTAIALKIVKTAAGAMITEDQSAVIDFLGSPAAHANGKVVRMDTHASIVFLAGARAYKLKRAVRYDYLDFSTAAQRRALCDAEVRLNRRTAPTLYRRVVAITREADGSCALEGNGTPVDWVVEMNRFPQDALFDRLASSSRLGLELMPPLAQSIIDLHRSAERRPDHGGERGMAWVIEGNAAGFAEFGAALGRYECYRVTDAACRELDRRTGLLEARRESGWVRQCHGDLHLRNIVLLNGRPTLFDGVEFNDDISCIDVLYDLAFLLMDLWRRQLPRHANVVWNRYVADMNELQGVALLPLFLSCRAAVRAKTSVTAAHLEKEPARRRELEELAAQYLSMAHDLLRPPDPSIVAVGGFSGSGKSTLAAALAPSVGRVPGAVVLRSDEIRKGLCGISPLEHLGPSGYGAAVSNRVYRTLAERAAAVAQAGHSVIVDAVFARAADREDLQRAAAEAAVPFVGIWLDAPEETLVARVGRRRNDPSDADAAVVRMQRTQEAGAIAWSRVDASGSADTVLQCVRSRIAA